MGTLYPCAQFVSPSWLAACHRAPIGVNHFYNRVRAGYYKHPRFSRRRARAQRARQRAGKQGEAIVGGNAWFDAHYPRRDHLIRMTILPAER